MTAWRFTVSAFLVLLSTVAGILGMGLIYTALTSGPLTLLVWGGPLTLFGLIWAGQALAQGQRAARAYRLLNRKT